MRFFRNIDILAKRKEECKQKYGSEKILFPFWAKTDIVVLRLSYQITGGTYEEIFYEHPYGEHRGR
jgi:hypothetical protein